MTKINWSRVFVSHEVIRQLPQCGRSSIYATASGKTDIQMEAWFVRAGCELKGSLQQCDLAFWLME
jgi:hypothetical protein